MRKWLRSIVHHDRDLQRLAREQALSLRRRQQAHTTRDVPTLASVLSAIRDDSAAPVFRVGPETFGLRAAILAQHLLAVGGTGSGKTTVIYAVLVAMVRAAATRTATSGADPETAGLGVEMLIIDPKDDIPRLKMLFAAMYLAAPPPTQRLLRGAFTAIEWHRDRVTAKPLVTRRAAVSVEYQAELITEIVVVTGPAEWTDGTRFLLFQIIRLLLYRELPFDAITIRVILTDEHYRLSLLDGLPVDLADYLGRLSQNVAAQTIAAFLRRVLMILSYPEVRATLSLPADAVRRSSTRPPSIVLASCGPGSALPPSIAFAQAHAVVVDDTLQTSIRNPQVPKIRLLDEFAHTMSQSPALLARYIDHLRTDRSAGVSSWAVSQSMDAIPNAAVEEILTNSGWVLALQSRERFANMLLPHLVTDRLDIGSEAERRAAFARELSSLPRQEGVLWVKTAGAVRFRALDVVDPTQVSGRSPSELIAIFDEVLASGSTIALTEAERVLAAWRAANLPDQTRTSKPMKADQQSLRDLLGLKRGSS